MTDPALKSLINKVKQLRHVRLVAGGIAAGLFVLTFIGAGAAPVGPNPVSEILGLNDHGAAVSDAVHEAKEGVEEGEKVGPAVSTAACEAAHDRTTLPEGAQNAPGQEGRELKDCTHPSNAESEDEPIEEPADTAEGDDTTEGDVETASQGAHGEAVSQAVHDAKANLEEGEKVGPAVSTAACEAAHNRTTLPEGAQNAPGQEGREPKDCTHPSNATGDDEPETESESASAGGGKGKANAPGQQR